MCSILFSTKRYEGNVEDINYYLKFRGPDYTNLEYHENCVFLHNLLSITGEFRPQPYKKGNVIAVYNGEIYNYKQFGTYNTDGECIIPLYEQFGEDFLKHVDGEYAVCLVDFEKNIAIISSDVFKTKPLFLVADGDHVACSSYRTPLENMGFKNIIKAEPNSTYVVSLLDKRIISKNKIHQFDINQHKNNYEDWILAFENSINKRVFQTDKNVFIGLSSGYDSGIIFHELVRQKKKFYSFSLLGTENQSIIDFRLASKGDMCESYTLNKSNEDYSYSHSVIEKTTEPFNYTIHSGTSNYNEYNTRLIEDGGANNFATICRAAKTFDCKVCLSGTGADEIISDYGFQGRKIYQHSTFGGLFPADLSTIFPWPSFYGSTMESYIAKEEYVGGSFGIEMRYPFLDVKLVQEFLWLHQDLKNKEYKAPIDYYFNKNNFKYAKQEKKGF